LINLKAKETIIANYRGLFQKHGGAPEAVQLSLEGQRFRFRKLMEIADLQNRRVLDLGCGIGDFYPPLLERFGQLDYTGIDLVPEMIDYAAMKFPRARFLCQDLFKDSLGETFDYVLISGVFNNAVSDCGAYMRELLALAFQSCTLGLGFNFISAHVNFVEPELAYHDPVQVFDFCIQNLTRRLVIHHHYERADVAVFAYRMERTPDFR
jgi:SAM-dependent methyltransferase